MGKIFIGWSERDITPGKPAYLVGQFHPRVSEYVDGPVKATALFAGTEKDYVVMVSCDLALINENIRERCREAVRKKTPAVDARKVVLNATHTHSAPGTEKRRYPPEPEGLMTADEYAQFLSCRVAEAVDEAWNNREEGGVSWAYGHAVVGHNRRVAYLDDLGKREGYRKMSGIITDGTSRMYGKTDDPRFSHVEGYEDHGVDMLFTWDGKNNPTGVIINLACPSQVEENSVFLTADFWHDVRTEVRNRCGMGLHVLSQSSAAGDQSPHLLVHKKEEERMLKLRGLTMRQEIGRRVARTVEDVLPLAKKDVRKEVPFRHAVKTVKIKKRMITGEEMKVIREEYEELEKQVPVDGKDAAMKHSALRRCKSAMARYEAQKANPFLEEEMHVIRIGDVAFATNRFELFLDYGLRVKARSPFLQTFIVQLAGGGEYTASYLPTERAVAGRSYGANVYDNEAGPEGGQQLVEETLKALEELLKAEEN